MRTFAAAKVIIALAKSYQYAEKERFKASGACFSPDFRKRIRLHLLLSVFMDFCKLGGT